MNRHHPEASFFCPSPGTRLPPGITTRGFYVTKGPLVLAGPFRSQAEADAALPSYGGEP